MEYRDPAVQDETFGCSSCEYRYNNNDHIAKGAFGTVFQATITTRGDFLGAEQVAVKVVHLDRQSKSLTDRKKWSKLRQRLENLPKLSHDHLVKYHKIMVAKGLRGGASIELMMDFHTGEDLRTVIQYLRQQGDLLTEAEAVSYTIQIAEGLQFLHGKHLIHGDLKPCNILTRSSENGDRKLAICDLDDIVQMERDGTCSHDITNLRGTYRFMSPEMLRKFVAMQKSENPGRKTDIWSLGCIMLDLANCVVGDDRKWLSKGRQKIEVGNKVNDERFIHLIVNGFVPCATETTASGLTVRAQQCLHTESSERICASSLIQQLKPKEFVMIVRSRPNFRYECYVFDPSTQTVTELAFPLDLIESRHNNLLAVSNGSVLYQRTQVREALPRTDMEDVEVLKWDVQKQSPPTVLFHHRVKYLYCPIAIKDKIYFLFLHISDPPQLRILDLRDGKDKILKQPPKKFHSRWRNFYCSRDDNRIIFIEEKWYRKPSMRVECFDTVTGEWESLPDLPGCRDDFAMVVLQKTVYVLGGYDRVNKSSSRSCLRLDLQSPTRQWETMRDLLEERMGHCAFVSDNMVYAVGGLDGKVAASRIMEVYDTERDVWSAVSLKGSSGFLDGECWWYKTFDITLNCPVSGLSQ